MPPESSSATSANDKANAVVTRLRHVTYIGKRFDTKDGQLVKTPAAQFYDGTASVIEVSAAEALATLLLEPHELDVLCLGRPKKGITQTRVTTTSRHVEGAITRTLDDFEFPKGIGWLLLDFDIKGMPPCVRERVDQLGGGLAALKSLWPELERAAYVYKPSSSGGVYIAGGDPQEATGFHLFVLVDNVARSKEFLLRLQTRAWGLGLAWYTLSRAGHRLERSVIDASVGSPERIVFIAPPKLGVGVYRDSLPLEWQEGAPLGLPELIDTACAEANRYAAFEAMAHEAASVQDRAIHKRAAKIVEKTGKTYEEARNIVSSAFSGRVLQDDDVIEDRRGMPLRVGDLLDQGPEKLSLPDPEEGHTYNPTAATFLWGKNFSEPRLVSHAHGVKTVYRFARFSHGLREAVAQKALALPPPAELADGRAQTLQEALEDCRLLSDQQARVAVVLAVAYRLGRRVPAQMSLHAVRVWIEGRIPDGLVSAGELDAVMERLASITSKRRAAALEVNALPTRARAVHEHDEVDHLSPLAPDQLSGVICIRAPMGSGKTQRVGKPLFDYAKATGTTAVAISPRVTLCRELAARLEIDDYRDVLDQGLRSGSAIAVCLPSITKAELGNYVDDAGIVFIDEATQILRFFAAKEHCRTSEAGPEGVLDKLVHLVRQAQTVVVADASLDERVIGFLEHCRPSERFRVIEMPPQPSAKNAQVISGTAPKVREAVAHFVLRELVAGGKVWLATEGKDLADAFNAYFVKEGFRTICLTGTNKDGSEQSAFMRSADLLSRNYDIVIASPVISSGISIEHVEKPHFTLVGYVGGGYTTTPADAAQQLGRVRYADRYVLGLEMTNLTGGQTWEAEVRGRLDASRQEGLNVRRSVYDGLVADIEAQSQNARSDFAAGLWWLLENEGCTLARGEALEDHPIGFTELAKKLKAKRRDDLINSTPISDETAELLKNITRTYADEVLLEGWRIRKALGKLELEGRDIDLWGGGRLLEYIERYEDLMALPIDRTDKLGTTLAHRNLRQARCSLYAELFAGFDIYADNWCTPQAAELIVDRLMERVDTFTAVGAAPVKYRASFADKTGRFRPPKRPRKPFKVVVEILEEAGLSLVKSRVRLSQNHAPQYNSEEISGQAADRAYVGTLCPKSVATMETIVRRRLGFDLKAELGEEFLSQDT